MGPPKGLSGLLGVGRGVGARARVGHGDGRRSTVSASDSVTATGSASVAGSEPALAWALPFCSVWPVLPRAQQLARVEALGREFVRRGMRDHAQRLRVYYLAVKKGLASPSGEVDVKWNEPFVLEWLKMLQVAPFERAYELRGRGSRCTACPKSSNEAPSLTEANFPVTVHGPGPRSAARIGPISSRTDRRRLSLAFTARA